MKKEMYEQITEKVVAALENGVVPWKKTWVGCSSPSNYVTKKRYRGINTFLLSCSDYASPYWVTFKQAQSLGGSVKKGEKSTTVIYWQFIEKEDAETGEKKKIPMMRSYQVFNLEQTTIEAPVVSSNNNPIELAEAMVAGMPNAPIIKNGESAYYRPSTDTVVVPTIDMFNSAESYYSTLFHELGHSPGHESRLNRKGVASVSHFGSDDYSFEELVAEFCAAYLCGETGITQPVIDNQASYIAGWLKVLSNDNTLLMKAASAAQKAADYISNQD